MKENKLMASFEALQKESQISLNTISNPDLFINDIKQGHWDGVLSTASSLRIPMYKLMNLYEHIVFELVEFKEMDLARSLIKQTQALTVMKQTHPERYQRLDTLITRNYIESKELYPYGNKEKRRQAILTELICEVAIVEPSRLLTLLSYALKYQQNMGLLQLESNGSSDAALSGPYDLFRGRIPTKDEEEETYPRSCSKTMLFDAKIQPEIIRFSPDGTMLIVGLINGFIEIYNPSTGKLRLDLPYQEKEEFMVHKGAVMAMNFSKKGDFLATGDQFATIKIWKLATGECIRIFESVHSEGITSLAFSKDDGQVLSSSFDHTVRIHGVKGAKTLKIFKGHTNYVNSAIWSNDCRHVISASSDGFVRVWDVQTAECLSSFQYNPQSVGLVKPIHTLLSMPGSLSDQFIVIDKSSTIQIMNITGEVIKSFALSKKSGSTCLQPPMEPTDLITAIVSPKGNWIYAVGEDSNLYCFSNISGELEYWLKLHPKEVIGISHHPFRNVLVSYSVASEVKIWKP